MSCSCSSSSSSCGANKCCEAKVSCSNHHPKAFRFGQFLMGLVMVLFGISHIVQGNSMAQLLQGWPMPLFFVYLSGAGLFLGGLALMLRRYASCAAYLLAGEIFIITLSIQVPGILHGDLMSATLALHNLALIGGLVLIGATGSQETFETL